MIFKISAIVVAVLMTAIVYLKIQNISLENDLNLTKNENEILKEELTYTKDVLVRTKTANNELSKLVNDYKISSQKLNDKLYKLETNITKLSTKHPKLVSNVINNAQKKTNRCIENITSGNVNNDGSYDDCD